MLIFLFYFFIFLQEVCVQEANLGKVAKSCTTQIKGSIFLKNKSNYFAHICPEYGFRVKIYPVNFQHRYSSLQCHDPSEIISNMMIWCSENISDYYQFCKQLCCPKIVWKPRFPKVCIIF